jgi:hypothetical protein
VLTGWTAEFQKRGYVNGPANLENVIIEIEHYPEHYRKKFLSADR